MKLQFPEENNNKIFDKNCSPQKKEINKNIQYDFLKKYRELYGNSFSDIELLDIFERNNYIDKKIIKDINVLLSIEKDKHLEDDDNNHSPSFAHNFNSKSAIIKNKFEQKENNNDSEIPSDYPPPPKDMDNTNIKNIKIYRYKKELFKKLKSVSNTYKGNKNKKDEIGNENDIISKTEYNINKQKEIKLIEIKKNNNDSPSPFCKPIQRKNINDINNINEDKKKLYQYFFMNMKNYSKISPKNRRENLGKSPDFEKRNNLFDISQDNDLNKQKILTYKKGMKSFYLNKKTSYNYLKINYEVNSIFIPACYDNPQREQFLQLINEKRKNNPDKVIEILFPQIPPSIYQFPFYSNLYPSYNQFNPYMNNMYGMPTSFPYSLQNSLNNIQNTNDYTNMMENSNNIHDSLNNKEVNQLNNNQLNNQVNNNINNNSSSINNFGMNNYSSHKSSGNISNSGNINTTSSLK